MSDRLPRFVRIFGFLTGACVTGAALLTLLLWISFDGRRTRQEITQHVRDEYQRTLRIEGDVELVLWPRPALATGRMSLSEPGREDVFAAVQSARFPLALWPLLRQQRRLVGANLEGLELRPARDAAGKWNFEDLLRVPGDTRLVTWDLQRLRTAGARIILRDAISKRRVEIGDLRLVTGALHAGASGWVSATGRLLEGDTDTEAALRASGGYSLRGSFSDGMMSDVALRLTGRVLGMENAEADVSTPRISWRPQGGGEVQGARLALRRPGEASLALHADLRRVQWSADGTRSEGAEAKFTLRGDASEAEVKMQLQGLQWRTDAIAAGAMRMEWRQRAGDLSTHGTANGTLRVEQPAGKLVMEVREGEMLPTHPRLNPANARAKFNGVMSYLLFPPASGPRAEARVDIGFGDDRLLLATQLLGLQPLAGKFTLDSEGFDFNRLLMTRNTTVPLGFELPADAVLDGQLRLESLRVNGLRVGEFASPVKLAGGKLELSPHRASLYGGEVKGSLSIAGDGQARWRGSVEGLALRTLLADTLAQAPFEGTLNAAGELLLPASRLLQPLPASTGKLRFSLKDAAWRGVDMAQTLREFRPAVKDKQDAARVPGEGESTILMNVAGVLDVQGGKGRLTNLSASNPWLKLSGGGEILFDQDTLDFGLRAAVGIPGPRSSAHDLGELRGKVLPLQLRGKVERPDVRMSLSAPPRPPRAPVPVPARPAVRSVPLASAPAASLQALPAAANP